MALSADGNTAIVGGVADNAAAGAAWTIPAAAASGPNREQAGRHRRGGNAGQGYSVALSGDGNTAILGGPLTTVASARREYSPAAAVLDPAA